MTYIVWDLINKCAVGKPYTSKQVARRARDRKDIQYGACRYVIKEQVAK